MNRAGIRGGPDAAGYIHPGSRTAIPAGLVRAAAGWQNGRNTEKSDLATMGMSGDDEVRLASV